MFYGKFPERDYQGKEWPHKSPRAKKAGSLLNSQGLCGMIFAITADGEFFKMNTNCQEVLMHSAAGAVVQTGQLSDIMITDLWPNGEKPSRTTKTATPQTTWS